MIPEDYAPNPVGRPSPYDAEYHPERAMQLARDFGYSPAQIAAEFGVSRPSLYDWADAHKEFSTALTRAKTFEEAHWESEGKQGLKDKSFNGQVWSKSMQARFRETYTDRSENLNTLKADDSMAAVMARIAENGRPSTGN